MLYQILGKTVDMPDCIGSWYQKFLKIKQSIYISTFDIFIKSRSVFQLKIVLGCFTWFAKRAYRHFFLKIAKIEYIATLFLCFCSVGWGQQIDKMWSLFTLNGNYDEFLYNIEPQLRVAYTTQYPFQQFLTNIGGGYALSNEWQAWLGQTFSADSQDALPGSLDEYRLWEQLVWNHSMQKNQLISRTRLEERKSLYFSPIACRLRERLLFKTPLTNNMSMIISDEFFINLNSVNWIITKRFDQNRAYIGVEQQLSPTMFLSAGYMNQYLSLKIPQFNPVLVINFTVNLVT